MKLQGTQGQVWPPLNPPETAAVIGDIITVTLCKQPKYAPNTITDPFKQTPTRTAMKKNIQQWNLILSEN